MNSLDYDTLYKAGMLIVGVIGTWKLVVEFLRGRHGHLREEYRFAQEFLSDVAENPKMHPFLLQKGYQAIAGDTRLSAAEIEYLLTLQDAPRALRDFILGRPYLDYMATLSGAKIVLKSRFQRRWPRWWRKGMYIVLYVGCYSLGVSPIYLAEAGQVLPMFALTGSVCFPAGYLALKAGVRIARAEILVQNQHKNGQPIVSAQGSSNPAMHADLARKTARGR